MLLLLLRRLRPGAAWAWPCRRALMGPALALMGLRASL